MAKIFLEPLAHENKAKIIQMPAKVKTVSQTALFKYSGKVGLEGAQYDPGAEPVVLPNPKLISSAPCAVCLHSARLGHSPYCGSCINEIAYLRVTNVYRLDKIFWYWVLIAAVFISLICGIIKWMPRAENVDPMSVPVRSIYTTTA